MQNPYSEQIRFKDIWGLMHLFTG